MNSQCEYLNDVINNLTVLVKSQDEQIKDLKFRLEKLEDGKLAESIDISKLNHNVNTKIDLDRLSTAQIPASKGWFGAQHYDTVQNSLSSLKEFYEHQDWKLLTNLGFTQIYSKKEEEENNFSILCRTEMNHKIEDITEEIYNQHIFMSGDSNIKHTEIVQSVGDGINVYYTQFNKFLICSEADAIYISQRIEYVDDAGIKTTAFPIISVTNSRKKPVEEFERLIFNIGGWILKALGSNKTLVNVFYNAKFSKTEIPETVISKHAKSVISMLRTLETSCNKNFVDYRLGSKIFEKTQTIILGEGGKMKQNYPELMRIEEGKEIGLVERK